MSLLSTCTSGGCGAKLGPAELSGLLSAIPVLRDPNLLVGFDASDDAAVYRLDDDTAVVSTVDFFPPMLDDPLEFGRVAAANALSDVYAMGGRPVLALNLVCFPGRMDMAILGEILRGGAEKVREAGAVLAGGHSIRDPEIKYGLAVTGLAHPDRVLRNNTCRDGDCLILTKPLGIGLALSALRAGSADAAMARRAVAVMERLNKYAAEKLPAYPVSACTDVTGFGLLVHACEMAGTEHTLTLDFDSLPLLPGTLDHAANFLATAAGQRNRLHAEGKIDIARLSPARQEVLFDPQTSGGLLVSVAAERAEALRDEIARDDPDAAIIGQVSAREEWAVVVV